MMHHLNTRKGDKPKWIMILRKSLKSFLKLENVSNETFDSIINSDELETEAEYRSDLARYKWMQYQMDGSSEKLPKLKRPPKPEDPHLKVTKKMKYMNWNSLRLMNIDKFNLNKCPKCENSHLTLRHIMDKHTKPDDQPVSPKENFQQIMDLSREIAEVEKLLINNEDIKSIQRIKQQLTELQIKIGIPKSRMDKLFQIYTELKQRSSKNKIQSPDHAQLSSQSKSESSPKLATNIATRNQPRSDDSTS